jgi:hypothetical protein
MEFNEGGIWEFSEWEIQLDRELESKYYNKCKHCIDIDNNKFRCPRIVVGTNEAGYNSTGICLDCILEAVKKMEDKD